MTNYTLYWRSFRGLLLRDISVLRREVIPFLIRTVMNPLMFVFVFTYLFPKMGQGFQSSATSGRLRHINSARTIGGGHLHSRHHGNRTAALNGNRGDARNPRPSDVSIAGNLGGD